MNETSAVAIRFEEADLLGLVGPEREAAMDALAVGKELPFAIVGGIVVCTGELDILAIAEVAGRQLMV